MIWYEANVESKDLWVSSIPCRRAASGGVALVMGVFVVVAVGPG